MLLAKRNTSMFCTVFAEIMVDTIDLVLLKNIHHRLVQGACRGEITSKRFSQ